MSAVSAYRQAEAMKGGAELDQEMYIATLGYVELYRTGTLQAYLRQKHPKYARETHYPPSFFIFFPPSHSLSLYNILCLLHCTFGLVWSVQDWVTP